MIDLRNPDTLTAYRAGFSESVRTDSNPALCVCPYPEGSPEWRAFNRGWNAHDPDANPETEAAP